MGKEIDWRSGGSHKGNKKGREVDWRRPKECDPEREKCDDRHVEVYEHPGTDEVIFSDEWNRGYKKKKPGFFDKMFGR